MGISIWVTRMDTLNGHLNAVMKALNIKVFAFFSLVYRIFIDKTDAL